jgi:hypothetical protein
MAQRGHHLTTEWVIGNSSLNLKILFRSNLASPSLKISYNMSFKIIRVSNTSSLIQARWVKAKCQLLSKGKKLPLLKAKKTWWHKFSPKDIRIQPSIQKLILLVLLWYLLIWDTNLKLIQPITLIHSIVILRNRVHHNLLPIDQKVVHQSLLTSLKPWSKIIIATTLL